MISRQHRKRHKSDKFPGELTGDGQEHLHEGQALQVKDSDICAMAEPYGPAMDKNSSMVKLHALVMDESSGGEAEHCGQLQTD